MKVSENTFKGPLVNHGSDNSCGGATLNFFRTKKMLFCTLTYA